MRVCFVNIHSELNSNFALTVGYPNAALNMQMFKAIKGIYLFNQER